MTRYRVRLILPVEDVERYPWRCFADLDYTLRRHGPWPRGELGYWQLAWAHQLNPAQPHSDDWLVALWCWPLGWDECSSCQGKGTSWDESTGGQCWDCRGGGVLPVKSRP